MTRRPGPSQPPVRDRGREAAGASRPRSPSRPLWGQGLPGPVSEQPRGPDPSASSPPTPGRATPDPHPRPDRPSGPSPERAGPTFRVQCSHFIWSGVGGDPGARPERSTGRLGPRRRPPAALCCLRPRAAPTQALRSANKRAGKGRTRARSQSERVGAERGPPHADAPKAQAGSRAGARSERELEAVRRVCTAARGAGSSVSDTHLSSVASSVETAPP